MGGGGVAYLVELTGDAAGGRSFPSSCRSGESRERENTVEFVEVHGQRGQGGGQQTAVTMAYTS